MYLMKVLTIAGLCAISASAVPGTVWHGSFTINDYALNGSSGISTPNAQGWADWSHYFFETYATGTNRYRNVNAQNTAVTFNALRYDTPRINSEFLILAARGSVITSGMVAKVFMGANPGYGNVYGNDWPLGTAYNRWVIFIDNDVLNVSNVSALNPMFKGLQTMMGFRAVSNSSALWTNNFAPEALGYAFWRNWCYNNISQWDAWRYAANYMLNNAGIGARISMGTAKTSGGVRYSTYNWSNATDAKAPDNADIILTYNNF